MTAIYIYIYIHSFSVSEADYTLDDSYWNVPQQQESPVGEFWIPFSVFGLGNSRTWCFLPAAYTGFKNTQTKLFTNNGGRDLFPPRITSNKNLSNVQNKSIFIKPLGQFSRLWISIVKLVVIFTPIIYNRILQILWIIKSSHDFVNIKIQINMYTIGIFTESFNFFFFSIKLIPVISKRLTSTPPGVGGGIIVHLNTPPIVFRSSSGE